MSEKMPTPEQPSSNQNEIANPKGNEEIGETVANNALETSTDSNKVNEGKRQRSRKGYLGNNRKKIPAGENSNNEVVDTSENKEVLANNTDKEVEKIQKVLDKAIKMNADSEVIERLKAQIAGLKKGENQKALNAKSKNKPKIKSQREKGPNSNSYAEIKILSQSIESRLSELENVLLKLEKSFESGGHEEESQLVDLEISEYKALKNIDLLRESILSYKEQSKDFGGNKRTGADNFEIRFLSLLERLNQYENEINVILSNDMDTELTEDLELVKSEESLKAKKILELQSKHDALREKISNITKFLDSLAQDKINDFINELTQQIEELKALEKYFADQNIPLPDGYIDSQSLENDLIKTLEALRELGKIPTGTEVLVPKRKDLVVNDNSKTVVAVAAGVAGAIAGELVDVLEKRGENGEKKAGVEGVILDAESDQKREKGEPKKITGEKADKVGNEKPENEAVSSEGEKKGGYEPFTWKIPTLKDHDYKKTITGVEAIKILGVALGTATIAAVGKLFDLLIISPFKFVGKLVGKFFNSGK